MEYVVIRVENLSKVYKLYSKPSDRIKDAFSFSKKVYYREHYALRDVSMNVYRGETVGIIGSNGSGKSTLLKIITGILQASSGTVSVNGRISALLELGAGFNMEYTGIENIYLNGTMIGFSKEEIDQKLDTILQFADIGDFVHQPVKTYSSGMFVRLAFAIAINIDPEILIVDEALSVGDVFFQAKCYKKFEEFKKKGKTILFVSHDLGSVSKYCDRVIILNKGVKLAEGRPKEMIDLYKKVLVNQLTPMVSMQNTFAYNEKINITWKDSMVKNPQVSEYGNKLAEIIDFCIMDSNGVITNRIHKGSDFYIKMKVLFNEDIQEPIFAYTIRDLKGTDITGTNTMFEKVFFDNPKAGDIKTITFKQNMLLQGGDYLLSLGCTGYREGVFTVYHRLYDLCNISVISDKNTVGYFDMYSIINID